MSMIMRVDGGGVTMEEVPRDVVEMNVVLKQEDGCVKNYNRGRKDHTYTWE